MIGISNAAEKVPSTYTLPVLPTNHMADKCYRNADTINTSKHFQMFIITELLK